MPVPRLDGRSSLMLLQECAAAAHAGAEWIERRRGVDQAPAGQRDAAALDQTPDSLRRDAHHALRRKLATIFVAGPVPGATGAVAAVRCERGPSWAERFIRSAVAMVVATASSRPGSGG